MVGCPVILQCGFHKKRADGGPVLAPLQKSLGEFVSFLPNLGASSPQLLTCKIRRDGLVVTEGSLGCPLDGSMCRV